MHLNLSIVILSLVALSHCSNEELEAEALAFIECIRTTLDGGLPSAGIPDHNPLSDPGPYSYIENNPNSVLQGNFTLFNLKINEITNFNEPKVKVTFSSELGGLITTTLTWDQIVANFNWVADGYFLDIPLSDRGTLSFAFKDLTITSMMMLRFKTDTEQAYIDYTEIIPSVTTVSAHYTGALEGVDDILSGMTTILFNSIPMSDISAALQDQINSKWLANDTRIDAILDNCQKKFYKVF